MPSVHDFIVNTIEDTPLNLSEYAGKVLLLVNVASACGLTPQYKALQSLQTNYAEQGFSVLAFPCNQFGAQEPGTPAEIQEFCSTNYQISFPLMAKIEVNGASRHPLYQFLAGDNATFPGDIGWNFEKFLIGKQGEVLQRFSPKTEPESEDVIAAIKAAL